MGHSNGFSVQHLYVLSSFGEQVNPSKKPGATHRAPIQSPLWQSKAPGVRQGNLPDARSSGFERREEGRGDREGPTWANFGCFFFFFNGPYYFFFGSFGDCYFSFCGAGGVCKKIQVLQGGQRGSSFWLCLHLQGSHKQRVLWSLRS